MYLSSMHSGCSQFGFANRLCGAKASVAIGSNPTMAAAGVQATDTL